MNPSKNHWSNERNTEYERLNEGERAEFPRRDAALLNVLRGIEASLAAIVRILYRAPGTSDDRTKDQAGR